MDWRALDERLIRRGELLLSLGFLDGYGAELMALNCGKVGRLFKLTGRYVGFLTVVRYLFSMPYMQLEGFTRALNRLIRKLPSVDYSWIRRRILTLNLSPYGSLRGSSEPALIAVDSSGLASTSPADGLHAYTAGRSATSRSTSQLTLRLRRL